MGFILDHTSLYDGHFSVLHLIIILVSVAVIAYCTAKLSTLRKKKKELEKAAVAARAAETAADTAE